MSPKFLRRMAFALLTAAASSSFAAEARAQTLGNDCGSPNAPVHPIDRAIESVGHIFDGSYVDAPCPLPKHKIWGSAEYMVTWLSGSQTPPLITTSANGVPAGTAGILNQPTTNVVFGGNNLGEDANSGMRFTLGSWLTDRYDRGAEISGFFLFGSQTDFAAAGAGNGNSVTVGRPIVRTDTGGEFVRYSALANQLAGSSSARFETNLWGLEVNALARERLVGATFITFLGGVRYLDLDQSLAVQDQSTPLLGPPPATIPLAMVGIANPDMARVTDTFRTHNQFIGAQIGFRTNTEIRRFDLGFAAKLAIGDTHQVVSLNGVSEALTSGGQTVLASPGGLLNTSSNIGRYTRDSFTFIPEFELKVGYRFTDYFSMFVSWDYLYWSRVAQPGNQVNRNVDLTRVPTFAPFNPGPVGAVGINSSNLSMNSIAFGACLKY